MLSRILKEFGETDGPVDMRELSRRLGVQQSALEGMLETLVRQGKLREVKPEDCERCQRSGHCAHDQRSGMTARTYELVGGS